MPTLCDYTRLLGQAFCSPHVGPLESKDGASQFIGSSTEYTTRPSGNTTSDVVFLCIELYTYFMILETQL